MEERFLAAYEAHADRVFRYCRYALSEREAALDATQECFLRYWQALLTGTEAQNERAFLLTIARRLVIDRYRKRKALSLEALAEGAGFDPADQNPGAEELAEGRRALAAIGELPEPYREALRLRYLEGLEPREIAEITEESANVISVRIHRGVELLRARFTKHDHD